MHFISCGVSIQLFEPEFAPVGRGRAILATLVSVPEAAVDEDDGFVFREKNIH